MHKTRKSHSPTPGGLARLLRRATPPFVAAVAISGALANTTSSVAVAARFLPVIFHRIL